MEIKIKGARVHNLKEVDLTLPHNKLIVITGLSGSGKSTLAFDTLFAEGQRRYVESLSAYARQFLGKIEKPDVDSITGIAPAIAVEQKVNTRNPRSTVGTSTEIYEYLRLLYGRIGRTFSPTSGEEVKAHSVDDVAEFIFSSAGKRSILSVPVKIAQGESVIERLMTLIKDGSRAVVVGGEIVDIQEYIQQKEHAEEFDVMVDRFAIPIEVDSQTKARVLDSVGRAFSLGAGEARVSIVGGESELFSSLFEADGITFERPSDQMFSFNNPLGACPKCEGYGKVVGIDENLVVPDKSKTIYNDAVACWRGETMKWWKNQLIEAGKLSGVPIHKPFHQFTREQKLALWSGNEHFHGLNDFFSMLEEGRYKIQYRVMLSRYTGKSICPECGGGRLRKEASYVKIGGKTITDLVFMPIVELQRFFASVELDKYEKELSSRILLEVTNRLQYLMDVGLGYLTLDRGSATLSGGESQRINLATSLGSALVGSLYILDEPSIGLHPKDNERLIKVLKQLRDLGNTVIVVEHDSEIMNQADVLVDIGPRAGRYGGEVVYNGAPKDIKKALKNSLTAQYLSGTKKMPAKDKVRPWSKFIEIKGARENNLKDIDVKIPLGVMTAVTGVSGSGKSSLIGDILYPALRREIADVGGSPGDFDSIEGDIKGLYSVEMVNQNPIGKSARSNPVTYVKAYDEIRKLFSGERSAEIQGLEPSAFSFNIAGGRCEECQGEGVIRVPMQFMADVELVCEECSGKRFKQKVLDVTYKGKNIYDVLEMSIDEAVEFFQKKGDRLCEKLCDKLGVLQAVGLGYIKLGQSSSTLSGGENQRVKLASFLLKENSSKPILFIFDEPTTGLHFHDIEKLLAAMEALVERGHTVVTIEHNMNVVRMCDWVIDLGLEGGDKGGQLLFEGAPSELAELNEHESYTAKYLKESFEKGI